MKKTVIFELPTDVVGVHERNTNGVFVAEKNGYLAILSGDNQWLEIPRLVPIHQFHGATPLGSITKAKDEGCTIYQYDSFYEFCEELGE